MGSRKYFFLYPFSLLYRLITDIRNYLFDSGVLPSESFEIPIISVGNLAVGGTGKTPHTEYLVNLLKGEFRVAVLSRGYKRRSTGFKVATAGTGFEVIGDEPLQIYLKFPDIIVAVDRDRVNGVRTIMKKFSGTEVIILDDAYQHREIKPGLSILLSDYNRLISRDYIMPYGKLRESRSNTDRAEVIIVTKTPVNLPDKTLLNIKEEIKPAQGQKLFFTSVNYGKPIPLFESSGTGKSGLPEKDSGEHGIVLVTGIANPYLLKEHLGKYFREIIHLDFPDHHRFEDKNIQSILTAWNSLKSPLKSIITTEKDSVRLKDFTDIPVSLKKTFYYIPISVEFVKNSKQDFDNLILEYVRKNKRNS